jgi:metal-responsive CopG/Arc/MetJ family transcriptional regulator
MYVPHMAARSVQISIDDELLKKVDARKDTRQHGRSAFIRRAIELYLELEKRRDIDRAYANAYGGHADAVFDELAELMEGQAWPER